jgi:hypothetical protein
VSQKTVLCARHNLYVSLQRISWLPKVYVIRCGKFHLAPQSDDPYVLHRVWFSAFQQDLTLPILYNFCLSLNSSMKWSIFSRSCDNSLMRTLGKSVRTATKPRARNARHCSWIPGRGNRLILFSKAFSPVLEPVQHFIQWLPGALCQRVKLRVGEADHSPLSRAYVMTGWSEHYITLWHVSGQILRASALRLWIWDVQDKISHLVEYWQFIHYNWNFEWGMFQLRVDPRRNPGICP